MIIKHINDLKMEGKMTVSNKKSYTKPTVTEYGNVNELTQASGTSDVRTDTIWYGEGDDVYSKDYTGSGAYTGS
jgi:hypothetical protein